MSDPIPSASADVDGGEQKLPANAEDRKAAAALSSLNANEMAADVGSPKGISSTDQEALGKAMSRLEIASGQSGANKDGSGAKKKESEVKKTVKTVKIVATDVTLLVEQLDLTKAKATELLKANDGDVKLALKTFITPVF